MNKNNKILFVIDEIELKYFEFNNLVTNFWLIKEFIERGYDVCITVKNLLFLDRNHPIAKVFQAAFKDFDLIKDEKPYTVSIEEFGTVFFRPDPPVDINYINATYILSHLDKEKTLCINSAESIRNFNEKLYINKFPELAPNNIVTSDSSLIKEFLFKENEVIVKPLDKCFSKGVFYLNKNDKNINAIIDTATNSGITSVMVQEFLPEISKGDKRLIFIMGEIFEYSVTKVATNNDFKFNEHIKANLIKGNLSDKEKQIEKIISKTLLNDGVYMAGLDVIDGKIIEINITSPCFFINEINSLYGIKFEKMIADRIENFIQNPKKLQKVAF